MASAVDFKGRAVIFAQYGTNSLNTLMSGYNATLNSGSTQNVSLTGAFSSSVNTGYYAIGRIDADLDDNQDPLIGNIGFYLSYWLHSSSAYMVSTGIQQTFKGLYTNTLGQSGETTDVTNTAFSVTDSSAVSTGQKVSARFVGDELEPIAELRLVIDNTSTNNAISYNSTTHSNGLYAYVSSARVVVTETSAELDALEGVVDAIVAQTEVLSAFYGDIIALCNSIYQRCGDMVTAQNLTNQYCQQIISLLENIDDTTTNIYDLLATQFALLISTIQIESTNIQDAIMEAEAKLEAYFDSAVTDSGITDAGIQSEDASTAIGGLNDSSSGYESTATDSFNRISSEFAGFTGGTLSGVALATSLFAQVFDALGEYKVVYIFPLLLGVCLVLIGRISRHSGGASSRKEDKEE